MKNLKIEINFEGLISDMFCDAEYDEHGASPSLSFQESLKVEIIRQVSATVIKSVKEESMRITHDLAKSTISDFVNNEMAGIVTRKLRAGEVRSKFGGFKSFDEIIESSLSSRNIDNAIKMHIDSKTDVFAKEMRARYDNVFAAKVVESLNKNKMLSPEVAKILLGDSN